MTASEEIQLLYEQEMKYTKPYVATQYGTVLNILTRLEKMITAIIKYLDKKNI